jgi:hypothetical protein
VLALMRDGRHVQAHRHLRRALCVLPTNPYLLRLRSGIAARLCG